MKTRNETSTRYGLIIKFNSIISNTSRGNQTVQNILYFSNLSKIEPKVLPRYTYSTIILCVLCTILWVAISPQSHRGASEQGRHSPSVSACACLWGEGGVTQGCTEIFLCIYLFIFGVAHTFWGACYSYVIEKYFLTLHV